MTALAAICFASEVEVRLLEHTAYRKEYHIVRIANTNAIIPVSPGGAKKIPSLCSEQAVRSNKVNVIARSVATRQSHEKIEIATLCSQRRIATPFQGSQ